MTDALAGFPGPEIEVPTDEEIGRAIRQIAYAVGHDDRAFKFYAHYLVSIDRPLLAEADGPRNIMIIHDGDPGEVDGPLERLIEFVTDAPCSVRAGVQVGRSMDPAHPLAVIDRAIERADAEVDRLTRKVQANAAELRPSTGRTPALAWRVTEDQIALHTARAVAAGLRGLWADVARVPARADEVQYWRSRCPVTADDIEAIGITREQWIAAWDGHIQIAWPEGNDREAHEVWASMLNHYQPWGMRPMDALDKIAAGEVSP